MTEIENDFFAKMLDELRAVNVKYGVPKGILLVPDRLEFSVKRNSYDNLHLSYKEYFDYLPEEILDIVVPLTINLLVQSGFPKDRIERSGKNCLSVEFDGNALLIVGSILSELLLQKRFTDEDISHIIGSIPRLRKSFTDSSDFEFEWNNEIAERYLKILEQIGATVMRNPDYVSEIETIKKKYVIQSKK